MIYSCFTEAHVETVKSRHGQAYALTQETCHNVYILLQDSRNPQGQPSPGTDVSQQFDTCLCMLQITFWNVQQLMDVKRELMPALRRNKAKSATRDAYSAFGAGENSKAARTIQVLLSYPETLYVRVVPIGACTR